MAESTKDTYELIYFPLEGRAGQIRLMFEKANQEYTNTLVQFQDWGNPETKPATPWGSLPVLKYNGQEITQTRAITRFVAKKLGYYPAGAVAQAHCDAIHDAIEDCLVKMMDVGKGKETAEKVNMRKEAMKNGTDFMPLLKKLEAFLVKVGGTHAVGDELSVSDFTIACYFNFIGGGFLDGITLDLLLCDCPTITNIVQRFFPDTYELIYFPLVGRAGQIRLMFENAKQEYTNTTVEFKDWKNPETKPDTPWGSLPVLKYNGQEITQTRAITRFVAKKVGYYPADVILQAHCDAIHDALEDCLVKMMDVGKGKDNDEKIKMRQEAMKNGTKFMPLLKKLEAFLVKVGGTHAVGDEMSVADFTIACYINNATGGFLDGITRDLLLGDCPTIMKVMQQFYPEDPRKAKEETKEAVGGSKMS